MISKYDFMSVSDNFQSNSKIDKERNYFYKILRQIA